MVRYYMWEVCPGSYKAADIYIYLALNLIFYNSLYYIYYIKYINYIYSGIYDVDYIVNIYSFPTEHLELNHPPNQSHLITLGIKICLENMNNL